MAMIVVHFAECDGCGRRFESETVPMHWLSVGRGTENDGRVFCSASCFAETEGVNPKHLAAHRMKKFLLTPRDLAVLRLVGQGKSNGEIAQELGIAVSTVKNHLSLNCANKLGARDRISIALIADRLGIIDLRAESARIVQRFEETPDACVDPEP